MEVDFMKRYVVWYGSGMMNHFESDSRNAKRHLLELGGDEVIITNKHGETISRAINSPEFGIVSVKV